MQGTHNLSPRQFVAVLCLSHCDCFREFCRSISILIPATKKIAPKKPKSFEETLGDTVNKLRGSIKSSNTSTSSAHCSSSSLSPITSRSAGRNSWPRSKEEYLHHLIILQKTMDRAIEVTPPLSARFGASFERFGESLAQHTGKMWLPYSEKEEAEAHEMRATYVSHPNSCRSELRSYRFGNRSGRAIEHLLFFVAAIHRRYDPEPSQR